MNYFLLKLSYFLLFVSFVLGVSTALILESSSVELKFLCVLEPFMDEQPITVLIVNAHKT